MATTVEARQSFTPLGSSQAHSLPSLRWVQKCPPFLNEFQIQDAEGIERMRASGQLAARVRDYAGTLVKPGVTTDDINRAVHQMIIDAGVILLL